MTHRTEHATTITPELGVLAELIYLVEMLAEDGFQPTDENAALFMAFDEALEQGKHLVAERLAMRSRLALEAGPVTAHAQLAIALTEHSQARRA